MEHAESQLPKTILPELELLKSELLESGAIWMAEAVGEEILKSSNSNTLHHLPAQYIAPFGDPKIDRELPDYGLSSGVLHEWFGTSQRESSHESFPPLTLVNLLIGNAITHRINSFPNFSLKQLLITWNRYILFIGKECWPSPYVLQKTLPYPELLSACLFIDVTSEEDRLWALDTALRSEASFAVVAYVPKLTVSQSKRFSLAITKSDRFAFLLRPTQEIASSSATATKWAVAPYTVSPCTVSPSASALHTSSRQHQYSLMWEVELLKQKGKQSRTRKWVVQLEEEFFSYERYRIQIPNHLSRAIPSGMVSEPREPLPQEHSPSRAYHRSKRGNFYQKVLSKTG